MKNFVYISHCSIVSKAICLIYSDSSLALYFVRSSKELNDIPPFPIFLLNNLIPITKLANSTNWVTFSDGFKDTNGPNAALGITLSSAAPTSKKKVVIK